MLNVFLTDHNDKSYLFLSGCYVQCSNFNSQFDKMIKPIQRLYNNMTKRMRMSLNLSGQQ